MNTAENNIEDHWDEPAEEEFSNQFELRITRRRVTIEPELMQRVDILAQRMGITTEALVNIWISERVALEEKFEQKFEERTEENDDRQQT